MDTSTTAGRCAFLFPGQGTIPSGEPPRTSTSGCLLRLAESAGLRLVEWLEAGARERLATTAVAQPAILIDSLAKAEALGVGGWRPAIVAGHSLGEYAALVTSSVLTAEDALRIVIERGRRMATVEGGMAAIVKLPPEKVVDICRRAGAGVVVANRNGPKQVVISGDRETLTVAMKLAEDAGGRAIPLEVSGPFHSPMMADAEDGLRPVIEEVTFREPHVPIISSASGRVERRGADLRRLLLTQITACVRWDEVTHALAAAGIEIAVEVGPGEVLTRLGRRALPGVRFLTFEEATNGGL